MASNVKAPAHGYVRGLAELKKVMGKGTLYDFLKFDAKDYVHYFQDFLGDTIDLNDWAVANSGGAGAADFAVPATKVVSGTIHAESGTTDNGSLSLIGPLIWKGDLNAGMEARFKVDDKTEIRFEIGFIDAVPAGNAGGVNDLDTPTANMGDGAVLIMDTDQTLKTLAFITEGATAGQDPKKTNVGTLAPTNNEYMTVRIQLAGNHAYCWVNGTLYASHDAVAAGALEGGTLLAPWVYLQSRSAATRKMDIDYIRVWQERE